MKSCVGLVDFTLKSVLWTGVFRNAAARVSKLELFGWPANMRKYDLLFGRQGLRGVELLGSVSQGELAGETPCVPWAPKRRGLPRICSRTP